MLNSSFGGYVFESDSDMEIALTPLTANDNLEHIYAELEEEVTIVHTLTLFSKPKCSCTFLYLDQNRGIY